MRKLSKYILMPLSVLLVLSLAVVALHLADGHVLQSAKASGSLLRSEKIVAVTRALPWNMDDILYTETSRYNVRRSSLVGLPGTALNLVRSGEFLLACESQVCAFVNSTCERPTLLDLLAIDNCHSFETPWPTSFVDRFLWPFHPYETNKDL